LGDRLAETAVADDDRARFRRLFGTVEAVCGTALAALQPVGQAHQEWRGRHRQSDDRAEQRIGRGKDEPGCGRLGEQDETEFAGLAEQQAQPDTSRPAVAEQPRQEADQDRLGDDDASGNPNDEQRPFGDDAPSIFRTSGATGEGIEALAEDILASVGGQKNGLAAKEAHFFRRWVRLEWGRAGERLLDESLGGETFVASAGGFDEAEAQFGAAVRRALAR